MELDNTTIMVAVGAVYAAAYALAKLTRTKKDDEVVDKIGMVLNFIFPFTGKAKKK